MIDGYFCYRPAYNPIFTPVMGSYQITNASAAASCRPAADHLTNDARRTLDLLGNRAQAQEPVVGQWISRTPESVAVGGIIDVYDTSS